LPGQADADVSSDTLWWIMGHGRGRGPKGAEASGAQRALKCAGREGAELPGRGPRGRHTAERSEEWQSGDTRPSSATVCGNTAPRRGIRAGALVAVCAGATDFRRRIRAGELLRM
jgi:hypothetical protein